LKYFEKPIFKIVEYVRGGILDNPEKLERSVIYLRRHEIDTEDDYFQIGQKTIMDNFYQAGSVLTREEGTRDIEGKYKKEIFKQEYYLEP